MKQNPLYPLFGVCFFMLFLASSCEKDPVTGEIKPLLEFKADKNYFIDTLYYDRGVADKEGEVFKYDVLDRVQSIKYYEILSRTNAVNNQRTCTFFYNGNNQLPAYMDVSWIEAYTYDYSYRIYYFYNSNNLKVKDSLVNLTGSTLFNRVHKYEYNDTTLLVKVKSYKINTGKLYRTDSVKIKNYNTDTLFSNCEDYSPITANSTGISYNSQYDDKVNPFSKLNITPALFLSNFLYFPASTKNLATTERFPINFNVSNNVLESSANSQGYTPVNVSNVFRITKSTQVQYDSKNRIVKQFYDDYYTPTNFRLMKTIYVYKY